MKGFSPRIVFGLIDSFILCSFLRGGLLEKHQELYRDNFY